MLPQRLKVPHATIKTQYSQINICLKKKMDGSKGEGGSQMGKMVVIFHCVLSCYMPAPDTSPHVTPTLREKGTFFSLGNNWGSKSRSPSPKASGSTDWYCITAASSPDAQPGFGNPGPEQGMDQTSKDRKMRIPGQGESQRSPWLISNNFLREK